MAAETANLQQTATERQRQGNVAKLVDRLSKDFGAINRPLGAVPGHNDIPLRRDKGSRRGARARFSYDPKHEDELRLEKDDVIENIEEAEDGWFKGSLKGRVGLFPANFVEVIPATASSTDEEGKAELNGAGDEGEMHGVIQPKKVRGIGFGDILGGGGAINLRQTKSPITGGAGGEQRKTTIEFKDKDGSFVKPAVTSLSSDSLRSSLSKGDSREFARVEFEYAPTNEDELRLAVGDTVSVLSKECEDPGWWYGELGGRKGVFPDNFVKLIPPDQVPKEKKGIPAPPPAVPAKPKGGGGRSTTPEPQKKQDRALNHSPVDMGVKANSLKASTLFESKKEEAVPKKLPGLPATSLASNNKPASPSSHPSRTESTNKILPSPKPGEGTVGDFPEVGGEKKLAHPTASRPKHPSRRPPSQLFLTQMGKDSSPGNDEAGSPESVAPAASTKKPIKPPPPSFSHSHSQESSSKDTVDTSSEQPLPPEKRLRTHRHVQGQSEAPSTVSMESFQELKMAFEAHKEDTSAKIALLEEQLARLTQDKKL